MPHLGQALRLLGGQVGTPTQREFAPDGQGGFEERSGRVRAQVRTGLRLAVGWRLGRAPRAPELLACRRLTRQWPVVSAAYLGVRQPSYPYLLRLRDGRSLLLDEPGDLVTAWVILFREEYRVDPSCQTILDVGANIGAFTLFAAQAAPEATI